MKPKYIVMLTKSKRSQLKELISSGEASAAIKGTSFDCPHNFPSLEQA